MTTEIIEPTQSAESGGGSDSENDVVKQLTPEQIEAVLELVEYSKGRISLSAEKLQRYWLGLTLALILVLAVLTLDEALRTGSRSELVAGGVFLTWFISGLGLEMIKLIQANKLDEEFEDFLDEIKASSDLDQQVDNVE